MEDIDFKEIKRWLGHGGMKRLAKEHGISLTSASLILSGKTTNIPFLERSIKRATENKIKILAAMKRLQEVEI